MEQKFVQTDLVMCRLHPHMVLNCINYKYNCPYTHRLACAKCLLEYNTVEGFEDLLEVLNGEKLITKDDEHPKSKQDMLNEYFNILEQDQEVVCHKFYNQYINRFTEDIKTQIQKLEEQLEEGIRKYKSFIAEIAQVKQSFQETNIIENLRQAFRQISKVQDYHQSQEWNMLEKKVQGFVFQFEDQLQNELNEACERLLKKEQEFLLPQLQSEFQINVTKKEVQKLKLGVFPPFTTICDKLFQFELIRKIQNNKDVHPKVSLLFKGSRHGMNAQAFWDKCSNKGPTIIFCKSMNGHVFGGYTPCQWISDVGGYQSDDSKSSFLFSATQNQIYPIESWQYAICCNSNSQGPAFGNGALQISNDFQNGCSNLNGFQTEPYIIEDPRTHLMGCEQPELEEMEVYLIL